MLLQLATRNHSSRAHSKAEIMATTAGAAGSAPEGSKLVMPPLTPAALCSSHHSIILS